MLGRVVFCFSTPVALQVHFVAKFWYPMRMVELGFRVLWMDSGDLHS